MKALSVSLCVIYCVTIVEGLNTKLDLGGFVNAAVTS